MNFGYTTPQGFVMGIRYRDAMIRAWAKRTGRMTRSGAFSYKPEDLPPGYDEPTNAERSRAEVIEFALRPLPPGESYGAYLSAPKPEHVGIANACGLSTGKGVITTFMGEPLAFVTKVTSYNAVRFGRDAGMNGSFWAIGIDGRTYYGRHNGRGMYCSMRLAKWADEFYVEQHTSEGWEIVTTEITLGAARSAMTTYQLNQPGHTVRIKHRKVRQE